VTLISGLLWSDRVTPEPGQKRKAGSIGDPLLGVQETLDDRLGPKPRKKAGKKKNVARTDKAERGPTWYDMKGSNAALMAAEVDDWAARRSSGPNGRVEILGILRSRLS